MKPLPSPAHARCAAALLALAPALAAPPPSPPSNAPPAPQEEDIRPAREAVALEPTRKPSLGPLLGGAAAATLAALAAWAWRRRRVAAILATPEERARQSLRDLGAQRETLSAAALADQAALAVRHFIAAKFHLAAPQQTTEEFLRAVAAASPLAPHRPLLQGFLHSCDLAKFAGAAFDPVERFALLETAQRFIQAAAYTAPPATSPPPQGNVPGTVKTEGI